MNILKALFGGKTEDPEERKQDEEAKNFDILKFDGVKALPMPWSIKKIWRYATIFRKLI